MTTALAVSTTLAVRLLSYDQLSAFAEALSQYCDNQSEHEEIEAGTPEFQASDKLKLCRAFLDTLEADRLRRLGV